MTELEARQWGLVNAEADLLARRLHRFIDCPVSSQPAQDPEKPPIPVTEASLAAGAKTSHT